MKQIVALLLLSVWPIAYAQSLCTAKPAHVPPGGVAILRCPCSGKISWTARSGGQLIGDGPIVKYDTTGVQVPSALVDASCSGKLVTPPLVIDLDFPPAPKQSQLCRIQFGRIKSRPILLENEQKACLDEIAFVLQRSDDNLIIFGKSAPTELNGGTKAAMRAIAVKKYLVEEKGINSSRISLRAQLNQSMEAEPIQIPSGSIPDIEGTYPVDEVRQQAIIPHP